MKTVLLIEDNDDIRKNTAEMLGFANYNVLTAENGKIGIELALAHKPDIIVCDIMMPGLDGYSVINILQKNPETEHIPFIFLSAKSERDEIRKGMEFGADDYVTKPFNETELLKTIEFRLNKLSKLQAKFSNGVSGLSDLLHEAGDDSLQKIVSEHTVNLYKKGVIIYSENQRPTNLFYIQKGTVRVYKVNDDGKELAMGLYGEGEFFGYISLIEKTNYKESAETLEDCEIVVIPKKEFDILLNNDKDVLLKFVQLLAGNVEEKKQQLLHLAYSSLRKKVADTLVTICRKYKATKDKPLIIDIDRDNLASIAGTAKESFVRTLSDFKEEKLIDIQNGNIIILDEKKLQNLLN